MRQCVVESNAVSGRGRFFPIVSTTRNGYHWVNSPGLLSQIPTLQSGLTSFYQIQSKKECGVDAPAQSPVMNGYLHCSWAVSPLWSVLSDTRFSGGQNKISKKPSNVGETSENKCKILRQGLFLLQPNLLFMHNKSPSHQHLKIKLLHQLTVLQARSPTHCGHTFCSGYCKAEIKVSAGLVLFAGSGGNPFASSFSLEKFHFLKVQNRGRSFPSGLSTESLSSLAVT